MLRSSGITSVPTDERKLTTVGTATRIGLKYWSTRQTVTADTGSLATCVSTVPDLPTPGVSVSPGNSMTSLWNAPGTKLRSGVVKVACGTQWGAGSAGSKY